MLTIYHAPNSRSHRLIWLCEEMGIPYKAQIEQFGKPSDEFKQANPLRAFPALKDGDDTMFESIAMMQYVMAKYGPTPVDVQASEPDFARYLQFLHYGEAGIAMWGNPLIASRMMCPEDQRDNWTNQFLRKRIADRIGYLERELAGKEFIAANRFTAADISCGYTLGIAKFVTDADLPASCAEYLKRLQARPAAQRAAAVK